MRKLSFTWKLIIGNLIYIVPTVGMAFGLDAKIAYGVLAIGAAVSLYLSLGAARNLNQATEKLRALAKESEASTQLLVTASQKVSSSSVEQASAIQQTVATLTEISTTVNRSVDNAQKSFTMAQASVEVASEGKRSVGEMILAIDEMSASNKTILSEINDSNQRISEIVQVITEIGSKTKVINDIVFQTKLLSFNASVEAARAGENGKGFAVVAEEVGNLAQMSGNAAKDIESMLNASIQKVQAIVHDSRLRVDALIAMGKTKIDSGLGIANQCGKILDEIVQNVKDVNGMISDISLGAKEQAQGISGISNAMNEIDTGTHQNAQTSRDTATYAQQFVAQTAALKKVIAALDKEFLGGGPTVSAVSVKKVTVPAAAEAPIRKTPEKIFPNKSPAKTAKPVLATRNNVVPLKAVDKIPSVNGDGIPSENDPRFKDI